MSQMGNNKNCWVWQWDVQASERRELATKKAALATAEIVNLSKCIPGDCQSQYPFFLMNVAGMGVALYFKFYV